MITLVQFKLAPLWVHDEGVK